MNTYPTYSNYKCSGISWLGDLPQHWFSTSVKYGFQITLGKMLQNEAKSSEDEFKPYLKAINIQTYGVNTDKVGKMWFSKSDREYLRLRFGDVLISEGGDVGRSTLWLDELPECYIQNAINRGRSKYGHSSKFLHYWMIMLKESGFIDILCNKATIAHYTAEKVENSPLFLPSQEESQIITSFLDHETAKIDTLIEKQQQLIKLLKEKRQAVISHAVTKGLNPDAPMKDSGVEWLGEVPEHWNVGAIKQFAKIESGHTPDKKIEEYWTDCDIPWVSLNDSKALKVVDYIKDTKYKVNELGIQNSSARLLPAQAVVFTRDASIGLSAITTKPMAVSQHIIAWLCYEDLIIPEFLLLVFYAMHEEFERYTFGATIKTIGMDDVRSLRAAIPPLDEQKKITNQVFETMTSMDVAITKAESLVSLLKERRTALISAAVTGKIDVRNWTPECT